MYVTVSSRIHSGPSPSVGSVTINTEIEMQTASHRDPCTIAVLAGLQGRWIRCNEIVHRFALEGTSHEGSLALFFPSYRYFLSNISEGFSVESV